MFLNKMGNDISLYGLGSNRSVALDALIAILKYEGYTIISQPNSSDPEPHYIELNDYGQYRVMYEEWTPRHLKQGDILHRVSLNRLFIPDEFEI